MQSVAGCDYYIYVQSRDRSANVSPHPALATSLTHPAIRRGDRLSLTARATVASGDAGGDTVLPHRGWPRGAGSERLFAKPGSAELRLRLPMLARRTRQRLPVYRIAPPHVPDAPALRAAGIELTRLTWLSPRDERATLWPGEQVARQRDGTTVPWLPRSPADTPCRRLQQAAERIEPGWWAAPRVVRDYWLARGLSGRRYWVFQDRASQAWLLHGGFD